MPRRVIASFFTVAALGCAATVPASADEIKLLFATIGGADTGLNVQVQHPWAKRINEQGKGIVQLDVRDGPTLANHNNSYERVVNDVIQVGWGLPAYITGKFNLVNVVALPFPPYRTEAASVALWRMYASGLLNSEFDEVQPLALTGFAQVNLNLVKEPKALDNFAGLKFASGSKIFSEMVLKLGGTPVTVPLLDYYQSLLRGTIDGAVVNWGQLETFKLGEVTFFHIDYPSIGAAGYVFMSRKKFAALPAEARKIIEANSGENQSRNFGKFNDAWEIQNRQKFSTMTNHKALELNVAQKQKWQHIYAQIAEDWVKTTPGGDKALAMFKDFLAKAEAEIR
jgi:TRAP-type C4-dicarboxylate transport system substrate-binding protein